ncbi:UDP-galactopyranose mutase [Campylobacter jejuni]|nr:UDP-galactopyranose mutase [Campylobacter jejuni]
MNKVKNLIVGCGLSGAILAERLSSKGEEVLIIDKREHIGGNIYDYKDQETNITIHKYGPHIFHTSIKEVWDYLSHFTQWNYFYLTPKVFIDGHKVTLPFNLNTLHEILPQFLANKLENKLIEKYSYNVKIPILQLINEQDNDLKFLAQYIYEKVFKNYTLKQWGLEPEEIDPNVTARVPIYISRDNGYFQDIYQGIPKEGYTKMIKNIINNPLITLRLKVDFKDMKNDISYEKLFYTGAIDEFFNYKFGELPYRSLHFDIRKENMEYFQESAVVNYPNNYDFTRICEHKYFLNEKSSKTIISIEYPKKFILGQNERYYPINNSDTQSLYEKYLQESKKLKHVYFLGRLGDYKYYDMDKTVDRTLKFAKEIR